MRESGQDQNIRRAGADRVSHGIALRIAAAGMFSIMAALLKLATVHGVVTLELVFYRALFGLPVVLVWVWASRGGLRTLATERPRAHLFRGALGVVSMFLTLQALSMMTLADATTIGFTAPLFATSFQPW